jgi:hypothetical protein
MDFYALAALGLKTRLLFRSGNYSDPPCNGSMWGQETIYEGKATNYSMHLRNQTQNLLRDLINLFANTCPGVCYDA